MVTFLFSAYFGSHFCYHSNGKSQIYTRLLRLVYCSNKPIRKNGKKSILFFGLIVEPKKPLNTRSSLASPKTPAPWADQDGGQVVPLGPIAPSR